MGRCAARPGPPCRNSSQGRSAPALSAATTSRANTSICSPSGRWWSSGTSKNRSVSTAPGCRNVITVRPYRAGRLWCQLMGSVIRPVGVAERRARLAVRHHLTAGARAGTGARAAAGAADLTGVVADIIGLHGTDPASVYLSAWARTGASPAVIEDALYTERSLVRILGMRRTVFVVPAGLVP